MYPSGYTQDTSRYIRIRILITNPPKLDNNPPRSPGYGLLEPLAHGTRSRCARASEQVSSSSSAVEYLQPQQLRYGIGGRRELYQLWEISTGSERHFSVTLA
jgi:hypothetical protein